MMEEENQRIALAYFKRDPLLYADMRECVLKGTAGFVYAGEDGVLLWDKHSGIYMLAVEEKIAAEKILNGLNAEAVASGGGWLVAHGQVSCEATEKAFVVGENVACYQIVCTSTEKMSLKGELEFRYPERTEIESIKRVYHRESPENLEKLCSEKQIYCGFVKEKTDGGERENFVGFIGRHPEGSMGLLFIFPEYRRRGYAEEMEKFLVNRIIEEGRVPYGHVIEDNEVSMNLQRKMGCDVAKEKVYWLAVKERR